MSATAAIPARKASEADGRPKLVFFHDPRSGRCRRAEGFLAQVLQRRRNHDTFDVVLVPIDEHPALADRFLIESVPTIVVVDDGRVKGRLTGCGGCRELETFLQPWLR